jgi:hypothetical protein
MAGWLEYVARAVLGLALLLSASWKLRHRSEFAAALAAMLPRRLRSARRALTSVIPVVEATCALVALSPLGSPLAVLPAAVFVLTVTVPLSAAPDLSAGCGCWTNPGVSVPRSVYLARNGVLALLAVGGALHQSPLSASVMLTAIPVAAIFALLLMELPEIAATLTTMKAGLA